MSEHPEKEPLILSEEELQNLSKHAWDLFDTYPETDPRSVRYARHTERPRIRWGFVSGFAAGLVMICFAAVLISRKLSLSAAGTAAAAAAAGLLYCIFLRRFLLTGLIRLYQHFAPDRIRNRCMFEPSCSEYMLQAVRKYGAFRGLVRGIRRLKRCNARGGGFDPP